MADKALLVGINKYQGSPLNGCVNDITDMANLLVSKYKFKSDTIRMLTDSRATTAAILERLTWLVSGTRTGDRIVFHYSGHGAQIASRNDISEVDRLYECACPVDFDWTPGRMIIDKQFYKIFSKMAPGVKFNFISDSCHSSDLIREILPKKAPKMISKTYPMLACEQWKVNVAKSKSIDSKALVNGILDVGFISGCKSNQTSADTVIKGRSNGALTAFLIQALRNMPTQPVSKVVNAVRIALKNARYTQEPQAEGARASKPFLM